MAHKKGVGSTDNGRDSNPKYLGVKLFGGQVAKAGNIIIRQRGTKYHPGENVYLGKDFTVHAKIDGVVAFNKRRNNRTYVSIIPNGTDSVATAPAPTKKAAKAPATANKLVGDTKNVAKNTTKSGKTEKIALPSGKKFKVDDLKIVEGIGPKIEELLHTGGITTWKALAESDVAKVQEILDAAGPRYRIHNPSTWAKQAQLCVDQKWAELEKLQDELDGGVDRSEEE